jgi:restriction system protein
LGHVFAVFVAGLIFLLGVFSAVRQRADRRLLDRHGDVDAMRSLTWQEFERLVGEAYRRRGYSVVPMGGGGADGGVDLVLTKDGTSLVQCKHWKAYRVGVKEVRELFGIVTAEKAKTGILITSGHFTDEAKAFAAGKPLELVDGHGLLRLVQGVQASTPVAPSKRSTTPAGDPTCPRCGASMVLRTARQGTSAGRQFWGCSKYPACRATADVSAPSSSPA